MSMCLGCASAGWLVDLFADLAVIFTLFVLWRGLSTWRDSVRGGDQYKVRRDAEVALLLYRERMREFRNVKSMPRVMPALPETWDPPLPPPRYRPPIDSQVLDVVEERLDRVVEAKGELLRALLTVEAVCDIRLPELLRELGDLEGEAAKAVLLLRVAMSYTPDVKVGIAIPLAWHNLETLWHVLCSEAGIYNDFSNRFDAALLSVRKRLRTGPTSRS